MASNGHNLEIRPLSPATGYSGQRLDQLKTELVSVARLWAAEEVRAAITHQLSDPLTALLFHLQSIKNEGEQPVTTEEHPVSEKIDMALHEARRIWTIIEPLSLPPEAPMNTEAAVTSGRDAIESWAASSIIESNRRMPPSSGDDTLTPREREVLDLIVGGASNKNGAYRLGVTKRTFEVHRANIMEKFRAKNAADLVRKVLSGNWEA